MQKIEQKKEICCVGIYVCILIKKELLNKFEFLIFAAKKLILKNILRAKNSFPKIKRGRGMALMQQIPYTIKINWLLS